MEKKNRLNTRRLPFVGAGTGRRLFLDLLLLSGARTLHIQTGGSGTEPPTTRRQVLPLTWRTASERERGAPVQSRLP